MTSLHRSSSISFHFLTVDGKRNKKKRSPCSFPYMAVERIFSMDGEEAEEEILTLRFVRFLSSPHMGRTRTA